MSLLSSELLKLRTTRVTWVLLGFAVLFSGIWAAGLVGSGSLEQDRALGLAQGASFATILAMLLGILLVTNEYRHGTVMTTFLVEPRRVHVLGAKLAASVVGALVFAAVSIATTAAVGLPWLAARDEALALDGQLGEAVGRLLLAFVLNALLGAAIGAIVQNQVGAIVGVFVWFLVVESLVSVLSGLIFSEVGERDPVTPYLPGSALNGIVGGEGSELLLRGGWAAVLALGYVAAASVVGAVAIARRDP
jgi:hypothetical protein